MRYDRRAVLVGSLGMVVSAGCLGTESLAEPFDLHITNDDSRERQLTVEIVHVSHETVYHERLTLAEDDERTVEAVATDTGRYRILVEDHTDADDEKTAERNIELSGRAGDRETEFCGWLLVRAERDGLAVSAPHCLSE